MSYKISFKVKAEDSEDSYVTVSDECLSATRNLRKVIKSATGLKWETEANNGPCKDIIPAIRSGLFELTTFLTRYKKYEDQKGFETIETCINFFRAIIGAWDRFCTNPLTKNLEDSTYFWIE